MILLHVIGHCQAHMARTHVLLGMDHFVDHV